MATRSAFGKVLQIILSQLNLNANMIYFTNSAGERVDIAPASVRNWKAGKSFPSEYNYVRLREILAYKIKERKGFSTALFARELKQRIPNFSQDIDEIMANEETDIAILQILDRAYDERANKGDIRLSTVENGDIQTIIQTKVVVFDFDGTLTQGNTIKTTWEAVWEILGYDIQECRDLHKRFDRHEITHDEWCTLTENKFKARRLHKSQLNDIIERIRLIADVERVFQRLSDDGIKICIVSGSIDFIIRNVLGSLCQYVHSIKSNVFDFDHEGYLSRIVGTKYDFEGKAHFITELTGELSILPRSVLFVGNSWNDEFVHLSGARTLCINPLQTSFHDIEKWNDAIEECKSLSEIYQFIKQ